MTSSAPTPSGSTGQAEAAQSGLLHRAGDLCRAAALAGALGFGAALAGMDAIAFADEPADSGSRTSAGAEPQEASRPVGSALSAPAHLSPSTLSRRLVGNRGIPATDTPIPDVRRSGHHLDVIRSDVLSYTLTAGPAAVTRLPISEPRSKANFSVRVGVTAAPMGVTEAPAAAVSNGLGSAWAPATPSSVTAAADIVPGPTASVVVGPAPVASSALTQSLIQSTSGLKGTVLGLDPAFFPVMGIWMDGFATSNGRKFKRVWYPNIPSLADSELGVAALDKSLHETPGLKIVFGHSMGAQVASKWLREKGPTSDIPATDVVFILGGNPERKYGGALLVPVKPKLWGFRPIHPTYGGPGVPDDTPYTVIDYARQYDWWADQPTSVAPSRTAQKNTSQLIHSNYFSVGIDDPDVLTYVEGNRIYKLKPTSIDASEQAVVERSYSRPTG